jgi:hypothetical protein
MGAMCQGAPDAGQQVTTVGIKRLCEAKHGKYTRSLPWTYRDTCKQAVIHAENKFNRPVYIIEIAHSWNQISSKPYMTPMFVLFAAADLYQNDELLASHNLEKFTMKVENQSQDYETYSDRKERKFKHLTLTGDHLRLVASANTPTLNFDQIKELLLSKGDERMDEYLKIINNEIKFLDKKCDLIGNRVTLATYPRTGNSFLRKILEQITGVFTGSDMSLNLTITLQQ